MPIPAFSENGVLPAGIHDASLTDLEDRFGQFQRTDQRCQLFKRLVSLLQQVRSTRLFVFAIIDGSFVTDKDSPDDIDLILVVRASHDFQMNVRPFEYNVLSKRRIRQEFGFDAVIAREDHEELDDYLDFFSQVRHHPDIRKGLVRVTL